MDLLQLSGTASIATLTVVSLLLSFDGRRGLFLTVGQTVFKWIAFALLVFFFTRVATSYFGVLPSIDARVINSIAFLLTVIGIVWSVVRHARQWRQR